MKKFLFLSFCIYLFTITFDTTCMLTRLVRQGNSRARFAMLQQRQRSFPNTGYPRVSTKSLLMERNRKLQELVDLQQEEIEDLKTEIATLKLGMTKQHHPHDEWPNTRYGNREHKQ